MSALIKTIKTYPTRRGGNKYAFVLCGFGGSIWQLKRLIRVVNRVGYHVIAIDFSEDVLSQGDPSLLPRLADEMTALAEAEQKKHANTMLLIGVSLGALLSLNILRRSKLFHQAVMITGGDIIKVGQRLYGPKIWPQTYDTLASEWAEVNMYTDPACLKDKRMIMILPKRDRLIDPDDVRREVRKQQLAGNRMTLIERPLFGHVGTIIEEALIFPGRTKSYIKHVTSSKN